MENKIVKTTVKILLILMLVLVMLSAVRATCGDVSSHIVFDLTKYVACGNDTVGLFISNISECNGMDASATYLTATGTQLCSLSISGGFAYCYFTVPDDAAGTKQIYVTISGSGSYKSPDFNLSTRPTFQQCYDPNGIPIWCNESCTDSQSKSVRKWQNVYAVSLPMHFTFGVFSSTSLLYNSSMNITNNTVLHGTMNINNKPTVKLFDCGAMSSTSCGCTTCEQSSSNPMWRAGPTSAQTDVFGDTSWKGIYICGSSPPSGTPVGQNYAPPNIITSSGDVVVRNASDYAPPTVSQANTSGCKGLPTCTFETHNISRYQYEWDISYDLIATAYSKTEYVPMFVGYNQTPIGGSSTVTQITQAISGPSGGCVGNSLCYTEVPLCGDDICDVKGGETCLTCPQDCSKPPMTSFDSRFFGNCSVGCTSCLSSDRNFSDIRGCVVAYKKEKEECDCENDQCTTGLTCTWKTIQGPGLPGRGRCCPSGEYWNTVDNVCEKFRKISITKITYEFENDPFAYAWRLCCWRDDAAWLKATVTFKNDGMVDETFLLDVGLSPEANSPWPTPIYSYIHERKITLVKGDSMDYVFRWSCVRIELGSCEKAVNIDPGTHENAPWDQRAHAKLYIGVDPGVSGGSGVHSDKNDHIQTLNADSMDCDNTNFACDKSSGLYSNTDLNLTQARYGVDAWGICGGTQRGSVPLYFIPTCCDTNTGFWDDCPIHEGWEDYYGE